MQCYFRENIWGNATFILSENIYMDPIKKIAITGPESTGKSTLARQLAEHYKTVWVPEYARTFINQLNRPYERYDLTEMAKGQISHEEKLLLESNNFLFCDTDLSVIKIWSEHKYGIVDPFIFAKYESDSYELYLLMDIDLGWEYDPQRENPELRKFFFDWFERILKTKSVPYRIIRGNVEERFQKAQKVLDEYFSTSRS